MGAPLTRYLLRYRKVKSFSLFFLGGGDRFRLQAILRGVGRHI
jgi:hypothetical protein